MGEFHEHHVQKRSRLLPLCKACVDTKLVMPHRMVAIEDLGVGDECVWCGTSDEPKHTPAVFLVDLQVVTDG